MIRRAVAAGPPAARILVSPVLFGLFALALVVVPLVAAPCADALTAKDRQMRQAVLVLRGYVDRAAGASWCEYPAASVVRRGGGLAAPIWPADPWTGAPLTPGRSRGHYAYRESPDRRSYRLTGYLSSGTYVTSGAMSRTMKLAYDHRSREGMQLILQYVELWAEMHGGVYPPGAEVDRHAAVGEQPMMLFWPSDPWTHEPMARGSGPGSFTYALLPGGGYSAHLELALSKGPTLTSATMEPLHQQRLAGEDETTVAGVRVLQGYVDEWALTHSGTLPTTGEMSPTGAVGLAHDFWPARPADGAPMAPGAGVGDYTYTPNGDRSYTIAAALAAAGAGDYTVTATPPAAP
jgi:hypothetical protein